MKKMSFLMLAAGSLAMLAAAKPVLRRYDDLNRRRAGTAPADTASGQPAIIGEEDMQPVAQESSIVADGTQHHDPAGAPPVQAAAVDAPPRKDGDFAPPVGA
ncbi:MULTISPECIES: hypothetical protein [Herbaspirillum]|jgi:hypothetical protein|uniref:hypothetical protein n=1 Tax=Herbaspirillum TaxID=963 RepID=UPI0004261C62|nr:MULTISPECIES: hypothetical protein [Herbaspirillum]MAF01788.1 hypothetical protein [Herbaspirillum sp.]MBN9359322.1 hypothetical protein [Herbaspirillum huttiense]MBO17116.1 hypothetical protein [Herbaspirillum sp.]MCP3656179.1 hypothetical protein [Herbaspirillum sp.]MCP3947047.1 hypothetical protein [Herbaspirillum sp.]|tara:strand:+ start:752 stop:1057 length:306 start_codon:yes stop_codon:yes gene_type:complete